MPAFSLSVSLKSSAAFGGPHLADAASLLADEWSGFALDFIGNTYAVRISPSVELLDSEWDGLALDFISNTYATRTATSAEKLLGTTMASSDTGIGLDFTTNTYAVGT